MFDLIVSRGRVADREARMIEGAVRTARELESRYGVRAEYVGTPAPPADDDWSVSLPRAKDTLDGLRKAMSDSVRNDGLTVMTSNTCSASLATLPVVARQYPDAVVLYVDAHGDFNTPETTDTGYLGGMVLAGACGLWDSGHGSGLRPEQAVLVGTRDIDEGERELVDSAGVRVIPPEEANGKNVLDAVDGARVWVHIDWDVLDPNTPVPADYEVPGGMMPEQIRDIFESIPPEQLLGIELAEFNAPTDEESTEKAVSVIIDMVSPALEAARPS
ncbi:arginase family protein [Actinopolyspora mortivallis]|uniref:Arginase n=1 Tax=Actinopolyspora mortivallis TaxID=33906 RepID=A0A2T0GSV4_ACTMO|nr:arginase family protein [Actinopolyspora mortivallis]PRW62196.1 arginase [Actinopolyspora mortivallis]